MAAAVEATPAMIAPPAERVSVPGRPRIVTERLSAIYGKSTAVKDVSLSFASGQVHALIGPSGCGKSTFLRTLNRMHELAGNGWITGKVLLDGQDIYDPGIDPMALRRMVGMVFQKPTPFPTMSIHGNVAAGLVAAQALPRPELEARVEEALRQAALWDEVKDRLHTSAMSLSGGQQQRLCIARTLAPRPEVVLLDEPTSALDPLGTLKIEELLVELKTAYTIVIVTHNMQQAARVSDTTSFFYMGTLVESGPTRQMFTTPKQERTETYITGRFG